jgi:ribosomal protein L37AE/L43A
MKTYIDYSCPYCFRTDLQEVRENTIWTCKKCKKDSSFYELVRSTPEGCVEIRDHELVRPAVVN